MITINNDSKVCYIGDNPVKLTKSEFKLISFFVENPNKVFSREELIKVAWTEEVSDRAVDTAISRLRKKLGEEGKRIISRIGFGYIYENN